MRFSVLCCATPILLVLGGCDALAQPSPAAVPAQASDAAFESAKAAFDALPQADRKAVQDALIWTGDYNGTVTGDFGRRTFEAIEAYARRAKLPTNATLDPASRKTLLSAAQRAREAAKFALLSDPATGIRLGVPAGILVKREVNPNGGTRWQSGDGKITLDTRAIPPGAGDLASLFERSASVQTPGRQVTYKLLRPDFFVVAGETATGKFYMRYAAGPAGLRGFSVGYDKSVAKSFDRIVLAVANSFVPFPAPATVGGAPNGPPPPRPSGPIIAELVGSGIAVGPTLVLASAIVERCAEPRVAGAAASMVKIDKTAGLALLEQRAGLRLSASGLDSGPAATSGTLIVLSYAAATQGGAELVATPASSATAQVIAALQPGAGGGAVLDRAGALVGVVGGATEAPSAIAGVVPPARWPLISTGTVRAFLGGNVDTQSNAPATGGERSAGEIATEWRARVVPVTCG